MFKFLNCISVATLMLTPFIPAHGQQQKIVSLPPVSTANIFSNSASEATQIHPEELGGNLLPIYKAKSGAGEQNIYYFLPYSYVDWNSVSADVELRCKTASASIERIAVPIDFYWDELIGEGTRRISDNL